MCGELLCLCFLTSSCMGLAVCACGMTQERRRTERCCRELLMSSVTHHPLLIHLTICLIAGAGTVLILDAFPPPYAWMRRFLAWWLNTVLPWVASFFVQDVQPYRYLAASIQVLRTPCMHACCPNKFSTCSCIKECTGCSNRSGTLAAGMKSARSMHVKVRQSLGPFFHTKACIMHASV